MSECRNYQADVGNEKHNILYRIHCVVQASRLNRLRRDTSRGHGDSSRGPQQRQLATAIHEHRLESLLGKKLGMFCRYFKLKRKFSFT